MANKNRIRINEWRAGALADFKTQTDKRILAAQDRFAERAFVLGKKEGFDKLPLIVVRRIGDSGEFGKLLRSKLVKQVRWDKMKQGKKAVTDFELRQYSAGEYPRQLDHEWDVFYESFSVLREAGPRYVNMIYFNIEGILRVSLQLHQTKGIEFAIGNPELFIDHSLKIADQAADSSVKNAIEYLDKISGCVGHSRSYNDLLELYNRYISNGYAYEHIVGRLRSVFEGLNQTFCNLLDESYKK